MREVILFLLAALSLVLGTRASGAAQGLETSLGALRTQNGLNSISQTLRYSTDRLGRNRSFLKNIGLDISLNAVEPDYSQIRVRKSDGTETSVQTSSRMEMSSTVGLTYSGSQTTVGGSWSGSWTPSPYSAQNVGVTLQQALAERTTLLNLSGDMGSQQAPASFFSDVETLQTRARPTLIHSNSVSGSVEQIISERYKIKIQLATGQRVEERPRNFSAAIGNRLSLSDRISAGLDLFALTENDNESLRDDRGYFSVWSGTLSLTFEPIYDWLVSVSYSLALEEEADPRRTFISRQGSDQYGLAIAYAAPFGTVYAKGSYLVSAFNLNQAQVAGGIAWNL